ncbi:MAG: putative Ig domain-containing protein [Spirochaetota bacterium]
MKNLIYIVVLSLFLGNCPGSTSSSNTNLLTAFVLLNQNSNTVSFSYPSESRDYYPTSEALSFSPTIGTSVSSYSVSSSLPSGMSIDSSSGIISGTPSVDTSAATYTVTATLSDGSNLTTSVNFGTQSRTAITCSYSGTTSGCTSAYPYTCSNSSSCYETNAGCLASAACEY